MREPVLTVHGYYDGPVQGLALHGGAPHVYNRVFDDATDDWTSAYILHPISGDELALVLEDWSIWCRFFAEWRERRAPMAPPFCLPADTERRSVIHPLVLSILDRPATSHLVRVAEFIGWRTRHEENAWQVTWHNPPQPFPQGWRLPNTTSAA